MAPVYQALCWCLEYVKYDLLSLILNLIRVNQIKKKKKGKELEIVKYGLKEQWRWWKVQEISIYLQKEKTRLNDGFSGKRVKESKESRNTLTVYMA